MGSVREIKEGRQEQGVEEEVTYTLTVPTTWGVPTGTPTIKVYSYDGITFTDVTTTIMPTVSASIASQVITLAEAKSMTVDVLYRFEMKFDTTSGGVKEAYAWVQCRR